MGTKGGGKSLRDRWKSFQNVFIRGAAPPPPSPGQSSEVQLPEQRERHGSKMPSGSVTELHTPPESTLAKARRATEKQPNARSLDMASLERTTESPSSTPQTQVQPVERQPEDEPETVSTEQQPTVLSKSQELWNAAYDSLEEDKETSKLVTSYVKTLATVLETGLGIGSGADVPAKLQDPTSRQVFMKEIVEKGQAKILTPSNVTKGVGDVAQFILSAKGLVDAAIQNIPQAALPWAGVCIVLQILLNPAKATRSNIAGIVHVVSRMDWYCALTEHLLNEDCVNASFEMILPQLKADILALYKALILYQMKSVCSYYRHKGYEFLRGLVNWDDWDSDLKIVADSEATLQRDLDQYSKLHSKSALAQLVERAKSMEELLGDIYQTLREYLALQKELQLDDIDRQCRWDLRVVDPKDDMKKIENKKDTLLPNAYEWVLDTDQYVRFTQWSDQPNHNSCQVLWIKGHAGTGKTMLLIGIIRSLEKQQDFSAPGISCFFCQGTDAILNNATAALRSLVWMLVVEQPHLISHLRNKYKVSGAAFFQDQNAFFALKEAFLSMLGDSKLSPVLFVVDALDECDRTKPGLDELICLISSSISRSNKVKWLLSSRPEIDVLARLKKLPRDTQDISESLVELDAQRLAAPVNAYIDHKLTTLRDRDGYDGSILAEVSNEVRQRAMNTFLWVSLVFQSLEKLHGGYAVQRIKDMPKGLLELYGHMMTRIENVEVIDPQDCKKVLVCAALAFRPISLSELAALTGMPHSITVAAVELCGSFLAVREETVYLIHQSAKDYLDKNFEARLELSGISQGHADIARRSINAMSRDLKQNMYGLDNDFKPEDMRPPQPDPLVSIRYSCVFWIDHLIAGITESLEGKRALADDGEVFTFLKERLLHWLESLSLLEKLLGGLQSIRKLLHIAQKSSGSSQLARFLQDVETFILSHGSIIRRAPLQTYASALVFSPTTSEVRTTQWKHRLPFVQQVTGTKAHLDVLRETLEGHSDSVISVAFSPDGKMLASASADKTVQLWNTDTWNYQQTLEGLSSQVESIAFLPDSQTLVLALNDQTIQLWNAVAMSHQQTLKGYGRSVRFIAFSPDGKTLASALNDKTIWLLNTVTGSHQQVLKGPSSSRVKSMAFSPDSKTVTLVLYIGTVWLYTMNTRSHQQILKGNDSSIMAIAFSLDSKTLASALNDQTIQLWNTVAGSHQQTLAGHDGSITSIAFSPDGKTLASASYTAIWLWDIATGSHQQMLQKHSDSVTFVAFSPNGKTLVSASKDKTIRLWNPAKSSHQQPREYSSLHSVISMAFSPDGKILALVLGNNIQLWNAATGSHQQTLAGHDGSITSIAFSPDGKMLASKSYTAVWLWDTATGSHQQTLTGHDSSIKSIAFSHDSKMLASTSHLTIWLWDTATGSRQQTLKVHRLPWLQFIHVAFSPDSKMLASTSHSTIWLWNIATGSRQQEPRGPRSSRVNSVAFSPDGKTLASALENKTIQLWNTDTGSQQNLGRCSRSVISMAFSPNSKTLASALDDKTILLLNTDTGSQQTLGRYSHSVTSMAFLPDGRYLTTNFGSLRLTPTSVSSEQYPCNSPSDHTLYITGEWIIVNGKKSLWLPADYRDSNVAVHGNKIVLEHELGGLAFLAVKFT